MAFGWSDWCGGTGRVGSGVTSLLLPHFQAELIGVQLEDFAFFLSPSLLPSIPPRVCAA